MQISGVESARRRTASHGRSAALLQPHVRLTKPVSATSGSILEGNGSHDRAMAARHRLDEKLRTAAAQCRSNKASSSSVATVPRQVGSMLSSSRDSGWQGKGEREERDICRVREERVELMVGGGRQPEECPVCLESFVSGQMVIDLPCHHRFHSTCLVPWLLSHCHCPFCRAHIAI